MEAEHLDELPIWKRFLAAFKTKLKACQISRWKNSQCSKKNFISSSDDEHFEKLEEHLAFFPPS